ncbi:MAG: TadE/TadG family type IV pilus assembly protein [Candidatus Acidiferrales bacterium]
MRNPQRGQSLIEFAFILPIFLLLMLGGADLIMAYSAKQNVNYVAEESARCLALAVGTPNPNCTNAQTYAQTLASGVGLPTSSQNDLTASALSACPNYAVTVTYLFTPVFPFFPPSIRLSSTAQFTCTP